MAKTKRQLMIEAATPTRSAVIEQNALVAREIDTLRSQRDLLATRLRSVLKKPTGRVLMRATETLEAIYGTHR